MLLVIGIDGATPELIERLTSTGQMPTVRSLMRHGVYGRLQSSVNTDRICAWSSVLTGVNPGKHGVWGLHNLVADSYQWRAANSRMLRAPTIAQLLTNRGHEVGTVFVPMTYPAPEAEWTTVSGWLAPSVDAEDFAHPRSVADLVRRTLGDTPLRVDVARHARAGNYEAGVEEAVAAMRAKASVARELLADRRWDMFAVNFDELARVLQRYWHLLDRNHVDFREDLRSSHPNLIADMHQEVDTVIGGLLESLGPDDRLLIVSPSGTQLNHRAASCVPDLMAHLGLLRTRSSAGGLWHSIGSFVDRGLSDLWITLREILPAGLAQRLPEPHEEDLSASEGDPWIDYERSWIIPSPGGHLYVNRESEFPLGRVADGHVDRLIMQINGALQTAIDPANGRRPLEWVERRETACSGPYVNRIPHVVTRWKSPRVLTGLTVTGPNGRVMVARPRGDGFPAGAAGPEGVVIAAGAGIGRGARIEGARVEDVTATIMHLSGERIPEYFDGQVLKQALSDRYLSEQPVRYLERELPRIIEDPARVQEASRAVESHLGGPTEEV